MSIVKPLTPNDIEIDDNEPEMDVEILSIEESEPDITVDENGDVTVDFSDGEADETEEPEGEHNENLVEYIDEGELQSIASELVESFENDRNSRKDWASSYIKGLDLLGMRTEDRSTPWQGASGVFHPMLTEAVVRFQAQAMGELMPASGPARSKVVGKITPERFEQSKRVETELNYLITEIMPDYRDEMEQMLFKLPLAGSAFKKIFYDPLLERPVSLFVPAEDFVISYGASNLRTAPRFTHVMKKTYNEVRELQVNGFYLDVDLPDPEQDVTDIEEKYSDLEGSERMGDDDDRHTILEMHIDIDLPEPFNDENGIARPYVVTIDKSSKTILAIRRNWYEEDEKKVKRMHFVHYPYLPGMGFYGTGMIHLIGGLAKSATSILRQLIDAGTLSNLPAGLKTRGLRIKGDNTPLMPGEWRDVDVPGGAIRDAIYPLPYKEPSGVLYSLLGNVVEEGRRIGSVADIQVGDMNSQAPVGTTLALLERSMKVMSGVQARLHAAMKNELRILARIVHDYMPEEYSYEQDEQFNRVDDFDGRVDVIPVSDPNASTMAQRIMQYQAALQLAQQAPQLYDMGKLHRQMLEVLGIPDAGDIIKLPEDIKAKDAVTENMSILKQEPVKAFDYQDHEAHIATHMAAMQDPKLQQMIGQSPFAGAIQAAMQSHVTEHVALQYRIDIQKNLGVEMPSYDKPLPESVERELSPLIQQAAEKLLAKDQGEAAQAEAAQQAADPLTQIQQRELAIKEKELQHKIQMDQAKLQIQSQTAQGNIAVQRERIDSEDKREGARIGVRLATQEKDLDLKKKQMAADFGMEVAKELGKDNV
tara:strand:- start:1542 stop:3998 length:2457 start_codon:yes stop_codon:yes gene_type:complete